MEDLFVLGPNLLNEAKLALDAIKKNDTTKADTLLAQLIQLSEIEWRIVLSQMQFANTERTLFFPVYEVGEKFHKEVQLLKEFLSIKDYRKVSSFLKKIIELEDDFLKKENSYKLEKRFATKVVAEYVVLLFLRNRIDPYVSGFGHRLDVLDYKIMHVDVYISDRWERFKDLISSLWNKNPPTPKKDLEVTRDDIYKQYTSLESHPKIFPHLKGNEPYEFIFLDVTNIMMLLVFGYVVGMHNIPTYIKKKYRELRDAKKERELYAFVDTYCANMTRTFYDYIRLKDNEIKTLGDRVDALEKTAQNTRTDLTPEEMRKFLTQISAELTSIKTLQAEIISSSHMEISNKTKEIADEIGRVINDSAASDKL